MKAICVDDERILMEDEVELCKRLPRIDEAHGFTRGTAALEWIRDNEVDLALLDIDMPDMNGLDLAMKIKEVRPNTLIVFVTAYEQYALKAFALHASGYLLKPITYEKLAAEVDYLLADRQEKAAESARVKIWTFGGFDVFVDGKAMSFPRSKAKELLAYLVDRQGVSVNRKTIYATLWEDGTYDRSSQKYLDVIIHCMRDTLKNYGVSDIVEMQRGLLRIVPEKVDCDMYKFFAGDAEAVNEYRGEYMNEYAWASMKEAYIDRIQGGGRYMTPKMYR